MHALALTLLAALATAGTANLTPDPASFLTVSGASDACGDNLYLSCCGSELDATPGHGDVSEHPGVVGGVLDGISLFAQCSVFSPSSRLSEADEPVAKYCHGVPTCCQISPSVAADGLSTAPLPCVPLGSLIQ